MKSRTLKESWKVKDKNDENNEESAEWKAFRYTDQHDQSDCNILKSRMLKESWEVENENDVLWVCIERII